MIQREVVVGHAEGVHALVAHDLARRAESFGSSIFLRSEGCSASLRSVVDVLALGLARGASVSVWADGLDEEEAVHAIAAYLADGA